MTNTTPRFMAEGTYGICLLTYGTLMNGTYWNHQRARNFSGPWQGMIMTSAEASPISSRT
uniref:Uncharacterized protein n=1 Tax=Salmonella sp. TaxID=599 RepID=A0A482ETC9_SALSP|nr:hypothetical protein NNIBIDOC_00124 [Salmonella sp.]